MDGTTNWTIAVYLAGGDGLTSGMIRTLQELRDEAIAEHALEVVAQFEPAGKIPRLFAFPERVLDKGTDVEAAPTEAGLVRVGIGVGVGPGPGGQPDCQSENRKTGECVTHESLPAAATVDRFW